MFTYPIMSSGTSYVSAFDDAVAALSPIVLYLFDDASFATSIVDSGSLSENMTLQTATAASVGPALRTTRSSSIAVPSWTSGNFATEGALYATTGNAFANAMDGLASYTTLMSFRFGTYTNSNECEMFRLATNATASTNEGFSLRRTGNKEISYHSRGGGGQQSVKSSALTQNTSHLVIVRHTPTGATGVKMALDGAEVATYYWAYAHNTVTETLKVGGQSAATTNPSDAVYMDCAAVWTSFLSNAQIADLWTLYNAEL